MSPVDVQCPGCGAPIMFQMGSSIVLVCPHCRSAVARGDRSVEDLGKVAAIADTGSAFELGDSGRWRKTSYQLVGRAQVGHQAGGSWDEWYAALGDGSWGWLAEAAGRYYFSFEFDGAPNDGGSRDSMARAHRLPPFEALVVGAVVEGLPIPVPLTVAEIGEARAVAAAGEIPYRLVPGETYRYADLSGPAGEFATLHYEPRRQESGGGRAGGDDQETATLYLGREVTLEELGLSPQRIARARATKRVAGLQLSCPRCAGALELRVPDRAARVTCPSCGSLLDVAAGNLQYLRALAPPEEKPVLPLGSTGELDGHRLAVIGFLRRSVEIEGVNYPWSEYLLHAPGPGFLWLVHSDGHWSLVRAVPPGTVRESGGRAFIEDRKFKRFQTAEAKVDQVLGEFYWKVSVGETVLSTDYVRPPESLSKEVTREILAPEPEEEKPRGLGKIWSKKKKPRAREMEVNWSLGRYTPREGIERAFGLKILERPKGVGPSEPFFTYGIYRKWGILAAATILAGLLVFASAPRKPVFRGTFPLEPEAGAHSVTVFSEPFDIEPWRNLEVAAEAPLDNSWVYLDGDLIHEETEEVHQFALPVEFYHGVDGGEAWSEGGRQSSLFLSAIPGGRYTLRLEFQWNAAKAPPPVTVAVRQGVPRLLNWALALIAVSALPILVGLRHLMFEKARWAESMYSS